MSRQNTLYQISEWTSTVRKHMSHLSKTQATMLALVSFAMALTRCCGQTMVSTMLAKLLKKDDEAVRQQVRELYYDAKDKRGNKRVAIDIETCFCPLLRWVLSFWQDARLVLILDATTLLDRFVVLAVSVAYRSIAIPVAWKILPGNQKHPWNPEWQRLLQLIKPAIPEHMTVLVLSDRGLFSHVLFREIKLLAWHPLMRINVGGKFRPENHSLFRPLCWFAPQAGAYWCGSGTAFKKNPLQCTLLAYWEYGYDEPWLLVTDLAPEDVQACWFSLRAWIEQGFRTTKRGCLQWHNTKMTDPDRAARMWLPIAITTLYLASIGTATDKEAMQNYQPLAEQVLDNYKLGRPPAKRLSVVKQGWINMLVTLLEDGMLIFSNLFPQPWPMLVPNG
ncbi:MAG: endonuclease [Pseudomonadota bacterium]